MNPVHILVAEDNLVDAKLLQMAFEIENQCGVDLVVAHDGAKALAHLSERLPDLVILDCDLPKRSGFEVLRAIREDQDRKHLRVVMFSSLPTDTIEENARKRNVAADAYFTKPFDYDDFLSVARRILRQFGQLKAA